MTDTIDIVFSTTRKDSIALILITIKCDEHTVHIFKKMVVLEVNQINVYPFD